MIEKIDAEGQDFSELMRKTYPQKEESGNFHEIKEDYKAALQRASGALEQAAVGLFSSGASQPGTPPKQVSLAILSALAQSTQKSND